MSKWMRPFAEIKEGVRLMLLKKALPIPAVYDPAWNLSDNTVMFFSTSQKAIGVAVFGGMLAATVFGVVLVPVLYAVMQGLREWVKGSKADPEPTEDAA